MDVKITVKLFASLREGRFDIAAKTVPEAMPVGQIIETLGIPLSQVSIVFLNGRHAKRNDLAQDGDTLALFPPVGGG